MTDAAVFRSRHVQRYAVSVTLISRFSPDSHSGIACQQEDGEAGYSQEVMNMGPRPTYFLD
jgi:hypothetical protein